MVWLWEILNPFSELGINWSCESLAYNYSGGEISLDWPYPLQWMQIELSARHQASFVDGETPVIIEASFYQS